MEVSIDGFPDGYVTDYGKAVDAPLKILAWVEAGFGFVFLALAFAPIGIRARAAARSSVARGGTSITRVGALVTRNATRGISRLC